MGLLDEIYTQQPGLLSSGNRLSGLLGEPINPIARRNRLADFGAPVPQADMRWLNEYMGNVLAGKYAKQGVTDFVNAVASNDPKQMLDYLGPGAIGKAGAVLQTAFHGSPYKFDQFDMSKIGTGEGAQVYGHGLYFSESPEVAKAYLPELDINQARELISQQILDKNIRYGLRVLPDSANIGEVLQPSYRWIDGDFTGKPLRGTSVAAIKNGDINSALQNLGMYVDHGPNGFYFGDEVALVGGRNPKRGQDHGEWTMQDAKVLAKYLKKDKGKSNLVGGNLYKVDIPDEAVSKMLDWDKPLSEQPQNVQDMMKKVFSAAGIPDAWKMDPDGNSARAWVQSALGDEGSRKAMLEAGIPGIKYFDGSSRAAGEGTRNFVVFDDKLPKIIERK